MDAHNTFEQPHAIEPAAFEGVRKGSSLLFRLPPKSVAVVAVH
jgi:alpha-L-arabinofuranosidase